MPNNIKLPKILKVTLRNFSLFSKNPSITVDFNEGVFCLAGANGLGKSTFLLAINFGITGIVPDERRKFLSIERYYSDSIQFSSKFFSGRINENDRASAEVSLEMIVGEFRYNITRGMFEPQKIRELEVLKREGNKYTKLKDFSKLTFDQKHQEYIRLIPEHVGLETFEQLVFLQLFVLTFDERRELLFWNERVLERVLYLAFGINPEEAKHADVLRKEFEDADSNVRNFNWEATQLRKRIQEIEDQRDTKKEKGEKREDLRIQYSQLTQSREKALIEVNGLENDLRDINLQVGNLSAKQAQLRNEYENLFSTYISHKSIIEYHPLIATALSEGKCGLCGSEGEGVIVAVQQVVASESCPICGNKVAERNNQESEQVFTKLQEVDEQLSKLKQSLDSSLTAQQRIITELEVANNALSAVTQHLRVFENANKLKLEQYQTNTVSTELDTLIANMVNQMENAFAKKDSAIKRREKKSKELKELQKRLQRQYAIAEAEFVASFNKLAVSFLGLDLNIKMEVHQGIAGGISLLLDVNSTPRRQNYQLSESQRYFIDIALRMAIAQFLSDSSSKSTLYIDTPEGSLDIAYESRAGEMFAQFIKSGYQIVMTANINTSQLLHRLAARCKSDMKLLRMTSWTDLSDVQIQEEDLFNKAFAEIEEFLL
mgnify:CR=1 FL=1